MNIKLTRNTIIMAAIAAVLIVVVIFLIIPHNSSQQVTNEYITPTKKPYNPKDPLPTSLTTRSIPTLAPTQGAGLNIESTTALESKQEIKKITPFLPFEKDMTISNGIQGSILIPSAENQTDEYSLIVNIYGVNYDVTPGTDEYNQSRDAFRIMADEVFYFIQTKEADPQKIIIQWGDRKSVQDRALEWLK